MARPRELTWRQAIEKVLKASEEPLRIEDITKAITTQGLKSTLGATPSATVGAALYTGLVTQGDDCPWEKVAKATFRWRHESTQRGFKAEVKAPLSVEVESESSVVTSFGMFWRRDHIRWTKKPSLLGMQQIGAKPVDFREQLGVYLLYDAREVVYVGRSTERPLGLRLYEHTLDRLGSRWDRFSWFGVRPVSEEGALGTPPVQYGSESLLPVLEAVLIEALEPRQNRKRGDDLGAVEYLQVLDESIRNSQAIQTMISAIQSK
jgi:hypothetical protein